MTALESLNPTLHCLLCPVTFYKGKTGETHQNLKMDEDGRVTVGYITTRRNVQTISFKLLGSLLKKFFPLHKLTFARTEWALCSEFLSRGLPRG